MVNYPQLLLLGAIAGLTIFLGFPIALMKGSPKRRAFLNALAMGILVFLVIDVFGHAWDIVTSAVVNGFTGKASMPNGIILLVSLFLGIALGLIGLSIYESKYMKGTAKTETRLENSMAGKDGTEIDRYRLAMMIAIGIGAHNFSEGLAIGQSYAAGVIGLALILIIGFAAHNATEGFGILGPIASGERRPPLGLLIRLGLIAGGPTFLGTLIGSLWVSPILYVLFLSFAGGALVFVILLMYSVASRQASNKTIMTGMFIGLLFGFVTDLIISIGGA